jgi:hypothetical protein
MHPTGKINWAASHDPAATGASESLHPIATGLPHSTLRFFLGFLGGAFFLHGLGRHFSGLLLAIHTFAHGVCSYEGWSQADPDEIK